MQISFENDGVLLKDTENFELAATLDCGQAFRWTPSSDGSWSGIAYGKALKIKQEGKAIILFGANKNDFESIWSSYFDLDRNYAEVISTVSADSRLKKAAEKGSGIRILRQEPWEALCSFIISQNNNIPRIKGIISRLCELLGEPCDNSGYSFPSAERLAACTPDELSPLRAGFRTGYLLDAAQKIASGQIKLEKLSELGLSEAREQLMAIRGVGPKVADCTLLFGLGFIEAFPQDVWIKRVMAEEFDGVLPECARPYAGIAQQYLFYSARG